MSPHSLLFAGAILAVAALSAPLPGLASPGRPSAVSGQPALGLGAEAEIRPALREVLEVTEAETFIPITLVLRAQPAAATLEVANRAIPRAERRRAVVAALRAHGDQIAGPLLAALAEAHALGRTAAPARHIWLGGVVAVRATPDLIRELARHPDVAAINFDRPVGEEILASDPESGLGDGALPTCGVMSVGAPEVWSTFGITGEGVVVGVIDTGTCLSHPDLSSRLWVNPGESQDGQDSDDNGYVDDLHGWNFQSNDNDLSDSNSHGTHVAGTVLGTGTNGTRTGVAPGAQLMTLKIWNNFAGESTVWEAMQYGVANGADILTASLGWPGWTQPDRETWRTICENAIAAGVVVIYAAGNEGTCCPPVGSVRTPGDVPDVITVGATNCADALANFSSQGPVTWTSITSFDDWPYPPGKLKPTISAPGVNVISTSNNCSGYFPNSGTSMATPHVAGLAALMLEANPALDHFGIKMILQETALDLGTPGHNNQFGAGRVQALAAVQAAIDLSTLGDLNGDGIVDFRDLLILLANWGPCSAPCPADLNNDGVVNFEDLILLLSAWG